MFNVRSQLPLVLFVFFTLYFSSVPNGNCHIILPQTDLYTKPNCRENSGLVLNCKCLKDHKDKMDSYCADLAWWNTTGLMKCKAYEYEKLGYKNVLAEFKCN